MVTPPTSTGVSKRKRRQRAGPSNGHDNILHFRDFLARSEFIGDCLARTPGFVPESFLPIAPINFDHHAIDLIGQTVAQVIQSLDDRR